MDSLTALRLKTLAFYVSVFFAAIGLVTTFLIPSTPVFFCEGILLYLIGRFLMAWVDRFRNTGDKPLILHNPTNTLFLIVLHSCWRFGGLFLVFRASSNAFWLLLAGSWLFGMFKASGQSEEQIIALVVKTYKEMRTLRPDVSDQTLFSAVSAFMLKRWKEPEYRIQSFAEQAGQKESLYEVINLLLIHRDITTGSNYMPQAGDLQAVMRDMTKTDRRKALVERLLAN